MLGAPFRGNYLNWPSIGEIDIMENINGRPTAFSTLHCGVVVGGPCNETNGIGGTTDNATLQDGFHTTMELDKSVAPMSCASADGVSFFAHPLDASLGQRHQPRVLRDPDMAIGGAFPRPSVLPPAAAATRLHSQVATPKPSPACH
jgi:hypothetical protein